MERQVCGTIRLASETEEAMMGALVNLCWDAWRTMSCLSSI